VALLFALTLFGVVAALLAEPGQAGNSLFTTEAHTTNYGAFAAQSARLLTSLPTLAVMPEPVTAIAALGTPAAQGYRDTARSASRPDLLASVPAAEQPVIQVSVTSDGLQVEAPPVAQFYADPMRGEAPLTVSFENDSWGDVVAYAWDFDGDGRADSDSPNPPPYTFASEGAHTVSLTVTGSDGSFDSISVEIVVYGGEAEAFSATVTLAAVTATATQALTYEAPGAMFYADPTRGQAPLTVYFENDSWGDIVTYAWDFDGDGRTDSSDPNPSPYTYLSEGTYTAALRVTGADGTSDQTTMEIVVFGALGGPTRTLTATRLPMLTPTHTPTQTSTVTVTVTASVTYTHTATVRPSVTPSVTLLPPSSTPPHLTTVEPEETAEISDEPLLVSRTPTPTPSATETPSPVPATQTPAAETATATPSMTPTTSSTPTVTLTATPTPTLTPAATSVSETPPD
jgi:PKD repeat protein